MNTLQTWEQFFTLATQRVEEGGMIPMDSIYFAGFIEHEIRSFEGDSYKSFWDLVLAGRDFREEPNRRLREHEQEIREIMRELVVPSKVMAEADKLEEALVNCFPTAVVEGIQTPNCTMPSQMAYGFLDWYRAMISVYYSPAMSAKTRLVMNLEVIVNIGDAEPQEDSIKLPVVIYTCLPVLFYQGNNNKGRKGRELKDSASKAYSFIEHTNKVISALFGRMQGIVGFKYEDGKKEDIAFYFMNREGGFSDWTTAIAEANSTYAEFSKGSPKSYNTKLALTQEELESKRRAAYYLGSPLVFGYQLIPTRINN